MFLCSDSTLLRLTNRNRIVKMEFNIIQEGGIALCQRIIIKE